MSGIGTSCPCDLKWIKRYDGWMDGLMSGELVGDRMGLNIWMKFQHILNNSLLCQYLPSIITIHHKQNK